MTLPAPTIIETDYVRLIMKRRTAIIIAFVSLTGICRGGDFNATLESILDASPALKAIKAGYEADMAAASTEANLPDPSLEGEHLWGGGGANKWNASIGWELEWPGSYFAKRGLAKCLEESRGAASLASRQLLRAEVGDALVRYVAASRKLSVARRLLASTDSVAQIVKTGIEHGLTTRLDESKIAIEKGRLAAMVLELSNDADAAAAEISAAAGHDVFPVLKAMQADFPSRLPYGEDYYMQKAATAPGVVLAEIEAAKAKSRLKVASNASCPALSVGYVHAYEEETHFNGGKVGVSLPLFSARGARKAAVAEVTAREMELENARQALVETTASQCRRLNELDKVIGELEAVFTGNAPTQMLMRSLELNRISLLQFLQERNYYAEAELDYIDLLASRAALLVSLESL